MQVDPSHETPDQFSVGWASGFLHRHSDVLCLVRGTVRDSQRMASKIVGPLKRFLVLELEPAMIEQKFKTVISFDECGREGTSVRNRKTTHIGERGAEGRAVHPGAGIDRRRITTVSAFYAVVPSVQEKVKVGFLPPRFILSGKFGHTSAGVNWDTAAGLFLEGFEEGGEDALVDDLD